MSLARDSEGRNWGKNISWPGLARTKVVLIPQSPLANQLTVRLRGRCQYAVRRLSPCFVQCSGVEMWLRRLTVMLQHVTRLLGWLTPSSLPSIEHSNARLVISNTKVSVWRWFNLIRLYLDSSFGLDLRPEAWQAEYTYSRTYSGIVGLMISEQSLNPFSNRPHYVLSPNGILWLDFHPKWTLFFKTGYPYLSDACIKDDPVADRKRPYCFFKCRIFQSSRRPTFPPNFRSALPRHILSPIVLFLSMSRQEGIYSCSPYIS